MIIMQVGKFRSQGTLKVHGTLRRLSALLLCLPLMAAAQDDIERIFWESVVCSSESHVRAYLEQYPDGAYVQEAEECLAGPEQDESDSRVEAQLAECDEHLAADRLTTGESGTALDCYRDVLTRAPGNERALEGIRRVEQRYVMLIERQLSSGSTERARRYLETLRSLNSRHPDLDRFANSIAAAEQPQTKDAAPGKLKVLVLPVYNQGAPGYLEDTATEGLVSALNDLPGFTLAVSFDGATGAGEIWAPEDPRRMWQESIGTRPGPGQITNMGAPDVPVVRDAGRRRNVDVVLMVSLVKNYLGEGESTHAVEVHAVRVADGGSAAENRLGLLRVRSDLVRDIAIKALAQLSH